MSRLMAIAMDAIEWNEGIMDMLTKHDLPIVVSDKSCDGMDSLLSAYNIAKYRN